MIAHGEDLDHLSDADDGAEDTDITFSEIVLAGDADPDTASSSDLSALIDAGIDPVEVADAAAEAVFAPDPLADASEAPAALDIPVDPGAEATAAAWRSGVDVRPAVTHTDVAAAVHVLDQVFGDPYGGHFYPPSLLRNIIAAGGPVLVAWDGDEPVATVLCLPAWSPDGPFVQSGPMAVLPSARGRRIAVALKLAQRAWCVDRGVLEVRWSFDLLVRTNARLNLHTLEAEAVEFLPGYEGVRPPGRAPELPNDRLLVRWDLTSAGNDRLMRRRRAQAAGNDVPWAVTDVDGSPTEHVGWQSLPLVRVAIPADVLSLRAEDPVAAAAWQSAVGTTLADALAGGWHVTVDGSGDYLLARP